MNYTKIYLSIVILMCILITPVFKANAADIELIGWSWSSNIGWVSFNCLNMPTSCVKSSYRVSIDTTNPTLATLSGYGWSSNIGWVKFDADDGTHPKPSVNLETGMVTGWIRACAGTINKNDPYLGFDDYPKHHPELVGDCSTHISRPDGWNGWIKLSDSQFFISPDSSVTKDKRGVTFDPLTNFFKGFSWGSYVVGWLKWNPSIDKTYDVRCKEPCVPIVDVLPLTASCTLPSSATISPGQTSVIVSPTINADGGVGPYTYVTLGQYAYSPPTPQSFRFTSVGSYENLKVTVQDSSNPKLSKDVICNTGVNTTRIIVTETSTFTGICPYDTLVGPNAILPVTVSPRTDGFATNGVLPYRITPNPVTLTQYGITTQKVVLSDSTPAPKTQTYEVMCDFNVVNVGEFGATCPYNEQIVIPYNQNIVTVDPKTSEFAIGGVQNRGLSPNTDGYKVIPPNKTFNGGDVGQIVVDSNIKVEDYSNPVKTAVTTCRFNVSKQPAPFQAFCPYDTNVTIPAGDTGITVYARHNPPPATGGTPDYSKSTSGYGITPPSIEFTNSDADKISGRFVTVNDYANPQNTKTLTCQFDVKKGGGSTNGKCGEPGEPKCPDPKLDPNPDVKLFIGTENQLKDKNVNTNIKDDPTAIAFAVRKGDTFSLKWDSRPLLSDYKCIPYTTKKSNGSDAFGSIPWNTNHSVEGIAANLQTTSIDPDTYEFKLICDHNIDPSANTLFSNVVKLQVRSAKIEEI